MHKIWLKIETSKASGPELEGNKATSDVRTKHVDPSTLLRKTEQTFIAQK